MNEKPIHQASPWRRRLYRIIFEADTPGGKAFDVALLVCIALSILAVLLDSVTWIRNDYRTILRAAEWAFTIIFSIEYILRLICVGSPIRYVFSFYGLVDLLSVAPTYLSLLVSGTQSLLVIRALRLLRVFRVMKLAHFVGEARVLRTAFRASARKIIVFLGTVLVIVLIMGAIMYLVEGEENGFTSIPQSIYWAIVTLTTVGYGDISPQTLAGKFLASIVMIIGYGIIAVPTGIVTVELSAARRATVSTRACPECAAEGHDPDARFCKVYGAELQKNETRP